ncbi:hypothetical protein [Tautonia plasticadhaerens]|uniref:hypothetical protein n=1 Tax=Tautonia plasticadhaerens TaxID=2527974 RepID=UPI001E40963D|nr:hypothetical protein [Tautonia plasticadhaerens]
MPLARPPRLSSIFGLLAVLSTLAPNASCPAADLHIGGATVSITPDRPAALAGQMQTRISQRVESPVTATALALESREGDRALDHAILVSCDLVAIEAAVLERVRQLVGERLPDVDPCKLVLSATHTHTAPVTAEGDYAIPEAGVMPPSEYAEFLSVRVADAVIRAWEERTPGRVGWGLGHAVLGQNRRSVYADGRAQMYGPTDRPDFRGIEGPEDHGVEVLFFWDSDGDLLATAINVACPPRRSWDARPSTPTSGTTSARRSAHATGRICSCWVGPARPETSPPTSCIASAPRNACGPSAA